MLMNWIKRRLGRSTSSEVSADPATDRARTIRLQDDESFAANRDVIDGLQFCATLHLRTPLTVLRHHGEKFAGPPSAAPKYGTSADGIWSYKTKSWAHLGIDMSELPESQHATDIGPLKASEYLPFLIEFREIVESDEPHEAKLSRLEGLSRRSELFSAIWVRLQSAYDDFPKSFFYFEFTKLPGVGRKMAKKLYDMGFRSVSEIANSNTERLTRVPGMGTATAEKILACREKQPGA